MSPEVTQYLDERQHEVNLIGSLIDTIRIVLACANDPDTLDPKGVLESLDGTLQVAERLCSQVSEALDSVVMRRRFETAGDAS